jgi:hypothetical protein
VATDNRAVETDHNKARKIVVDNRNKGHNKEEGRNNKAADRRD